MAATIPRRFPLVVIGSIAAVAGIVGTGLAGLVLLGLVGGGMGSAASHVVTTSDCPRGREVRVGYVRVEGRVEAGLGDTYTLPEAGDVLANARDEQSRVCTLPAGTQIRLAERPGRARSGTWIPVYADAWD